MSQEKLIDAVRREDWEQARLLLERNSAKAVPRGAFPFNTSDTIY